MKYQKIQYCIVSNGKMKENSIRHGRLKCIQDFTSKNPFYSDWKVAYKMGVRCIKIEITIEEAAKHPTTPNF